MRTRLFFAIGVSLWSAVAAGGQTTAAGALSGALRAHVQDELSGAITGQPKGW